MRKPASQKREMREDAERSLRLPPARTRTTSQLLPTGRKRRAVDQGLGPRSRKSGGGTQEKRACTGCTGAVPRGPVGSRGGAGSEVCEH